MSISEEILKRDRTILLAGFVSLTLLAAFYIWRGAGMGMTALTMTQWALFPHLTPEPMPDMVMAPISWLTVVAMWWVMMIAMMTPSAAPLALLYARIVRHASAQNPEIAPRLQTLLLLGGYLLAWLCFSLLAAGAQYALATAGLISSMMLWSKSALLSSAVLALAGAYQLSPLKYACLERCRGPAHFIATHMRQGPEGALLMGIQHGAWCVGCCWMLMALLFVGGVMNLIWIALLAMLVLIEKAAPAGVVTGKVIGVLLLAWSAATWVMR